MVDEKENVADNHSQAATDTEDTSLLDTVADVGADEISGETDGIHRDSETLNLLGGPVTHLLDDSWQEDTETVQDRVTAVLRNRQSPNGPVLGSSNDILLMEFLARHRLTDFGSSKVQEVLAILFSEELGGSRSVGENEGDNEGGKHGWDTIDGENPSPGSPSGCTLLLAIPVIQLTNTKCDEATDSSGDGRDRVEVRITEGNVSLLVKSSQVQP